LLPHRTSDFNPETPAILAGVFLRCPTSLERIMHFLPQIAQFYSFQPFKSAIDGATVVTTAKIAPLTGEFSL
jgi:hypothetical protein